MTMKAPLTLARARLRQQDYGGIRFHLILSRPQAECGRFAPKQTRPSVHPAFVVLAAGRVAVIISNFILLTPLIRFSVYMKEGLSLP
jgi:hypothetical protein